MPGDIQGRLSATAPTNQIGSGERLVSLEPVPAKTNQVDEASAERAAARCKTTKSYILEDSLWPCELKSVATVNPSDRECCRILLDKKSQYRFHLPQ